LLRDHFRNEAKKCSKSSQNTCILLSNVEQSRVIDHVKITRLKSSQPLQVNPLFEPNIPNKLFPKYQTQPQMNPILAQFTYRSLEFFKAEICDLVEIFVGNMTWIFIWIISRRIIWFSGRSVVGTFRNIPVGTFSFSVYVF